jgi:hypothetical protein
MISRRLWTVSWLLLAAAAPGAAQINALSSVLSVTPPQKIVAKPNETVAAELRVDLRSGYHVNSDKPADQYLIPLSFKLPAGTVQLTEVKWPQPVFEKFEFSEKPLSVFEGRFTVSTKIKIAANAQPGPMKVTGKFRYQACNDKMCLPPRTLDVVLPLEIRN